MTAIFRDKLGQFEIEEIKSMSYLSGVWYVTFLYGVEKEYHETELLEVSL